MEKHNCCVFHPLFLFVFKMFITDLIMSAGHSDLIEETPAILNTFLNCGWRLELRGGALATEEATAPVDRGCPAVAPRCCGEPEVRGEALDRWWAPGDDHDGQNGGRRTRHRWRPLVTGALRRHISTVGGGAPAPWNRRKHVAPLLKNRGGLGRVWPERRSLSHLALPRTEGLGFKDGTGLGAPKPVIRVAEGCRGTAAPGWPGTDGRRPGSFPYKLDTRPPEPENGEDLLGENCAKERLPTWEGGCWHGRREALSRTPSPFSFPSAGHPQDPKNPYRVGEFGREGRLVPTPTGNLRPTGRGCRGL
ncbi:hypothetical protein NDU88_007627 [Pleurodeles waltl]|uniref:Uncharacterized protein n=1 Tax=Pleurodeles waltl TaxID=8319 RepID=A0AAV7U0D4_PLEWA|nr:hypothetical protein NDU88_007627 [Pleurodeles waltl]